MKTEKMSFENIKDVLSREEMKQIMAGSGSGVTCTISVTYGGTTYTYSGGCSGNSVSECAGYAEATCATHGANGATQCNSGCY